MLYPGPGGPQGFWNVSGKWQFPSGDSLKFYNGDSPLPESYLKVIRFEPWTHNILLKGSLFKHLWSYCQHTVLGSPKRPSMTTGNVSQPFQGSIGQSKKFNTENAEAEVSLLKFFKGVAANQYFQMCIYHAGREVTHREQKKHTEIFQFFIVQRV